MEKFLASVQQKQQQERGPHAAEQAPAATNEDETAPKKKKKSLPKGVVLGADGKPCRSCTSFAAWAQMTKSQPSSSSAKPVSKTPFSSGAVPAQSEDNGLPAHCPPDVEVLGRSTWTFLHTLSASYPSSASSTQQSEMKQFLNLFSRLYPCWHCAEDFQTWMKTPGNEPKVEGREPFGRWMCEAHNEVNRKLGKEEFNCNLWKERWKDGPMDGSCG